ncbi:transposase [Glaesserella sp.]|uniref:transposase n=1 Tax=Glaesserella sp. TaxID=2094731 RepID=UPI0035A05EAA
MSHPYQFRLDIIKLVIEQDVGIREVAKLHHIPLSVVIHWLKAFRERGFDGVKSPYTRITGRRSEICATYGISPSAT